MSFRAITHGRCSAQLSPRCGMFHTAVNIRRGARAHGEVTEYISGTKRETEARVLGITNDWIAVQLTGRQKAKQKNSSTNKVFWKFELPLVAQL